MTRIQSIQPAVLMCWVKMVAVTKENYSAVNVTTFNIQINQYRKKK